MCYCIFCSQRQFELVWLLLMNTTSLKIASFINYAPPLCNNTHCSYVEAGLAFSFSFLCLSEYEFA